MHDDRELLALIQQTEHARRGPADHVAGAALADDLAGDAPMPIPSTWLHPPREETTSWGTRQLAAAGLGLGLGLLIVVPALIWSLPQGALPGRSTPEMARRPPPDSRSPAMAAFASADGQTHGRLAATDIPHAVAAPSKADAAEDTETTLLLARSELLASSGDLAGARALLHESADRERGVILFALAETFDPNMLAAWGLRDQHADPARARGLYEQARAKGIERARSRLEALK